MKPYIIMVAYDGTDYHGWQEQIYDRTVAGTLQKSFERVFGHPIKTVGASRTDAGVHACCQIARFYTNLSLDTTVMLRSWNGALPNDITLISLTPSPDYFHPQHNVIKKTYHYYVSSDRALPFDSRYVYYYPYKFCINKLNHTLQLFVGTHNFAAFCTGNFSTDITECTVDSITLTFDKERKIYCIEVQGKRFLHHMIRRIVGAALKSASQDNYSHHAIIDALNQGIINHRLPTAPACGLVLKKIIYERSPYE